MTGKQVNDAQFLKKIKSGIKEINVPKRGK